MRTHGRTTSKDSERTTTHPAPARTQPPSARASLPAAQRAYGNRAVGALLGQPLEPGLRSRLESRLGADFTGVRLHVDAKSPRELGAPAVTQGEHIYLAQGEHRPDSAAGARLLTHELAHVVQQRGPAGTPLAAGRAEAEADAAVAGGATPTPGSVPAGAVQPAPSALGRKPYPKRPEPSFVENVGAGAAAIISGATGHSLITRVRDWGPNQEGAELAAGIDQGTRSYRETADALDAASNPERVAAALMKSPTLSSDLALDRMAQTPDGLHLLDRLYEQLTAGATGPIGSFFRGLSPVPFKDDSGDLMYAAARVMHARVSATPPERWAHAVAHPENLKVIPFQMQGFTTSLQTPMVFWFTPEGKLRVQMSTGVPGAYPEEWKTVVNHSYAATIELDPDEIIHVRRYDQGGRLDTVPARQLFHLQQEYLRDTSANIQLMAGLGFGVGGGLGSAGKKGAAKWLARADNAGLALSVAAPLVNENRHWLKENGLGPAVDTFDVLNAAGQLYSLGRLAQSVPGMAGAVRKRYAEFKELRRQLGEGLPSERVAALDAIERQLAAVPEPARESVPGPTPDAAAKSGPDQVPPALESAGPGSGPRAAEGDGAGPGTRPRDGMDLMDPRRLAPQLAPKKVMRMDPVYLEGKLDGPQQPQEPSGRLATAGAAVPEGTGLPPFMLSPPTEAPLPPARDTTPTGNSAEPQSTFQAYAPNPMPSVGSRGRPVDAPTATEPATAPRSETPSEPSQRTRPSADALDDPTPLRLPGERSREQSGGLTAPGAPSSGPMTAPRAEGGGPRYFPPAHTTPPPVAEPEEERTPLELTKKIPLIKVRRGVFRMTPELRALFRDLPIYLDPVKNEWMDSPGVLQPDHFVPVTYILNEIIGPQRINLLTNEQISALLTWEGNIAAFPAPQNYSKAGRLPSQWRKFRGEDIDPAWSKEAYRYEQEIIAELTRTMNDYIAANQAAAAKPKKKK
ncbi:eCIS core domain-containing protein [Streptomyces flaveus]|uniref:eCIS core domain-containing protein n=1 Tax=Streptomyces flaveus TaxID=66370 RepID=UPI0033181451